MTYNQANTPNNKEVSTLRRKNGKGKKPTITTAAVIVAHPDDETLWAGGTILAHPERQWTVVALCRGSDPDRAPKFRRVLKELGASGDLGDLDDNPEQSPLTDQAVQQSILSLLPQRRFDLIITHSLRGEYTSHRRHTETSNAILALWKKCELSTPELWMFAYDDGGGRHLPKAIPKAHRFNILLQDQWMQKYRLITEIYGFEPFSYEAQTTPKIEAFWCFRSPRDIENWFTKEGRKRI